jgi:hypothetical protein
MDSFIVVATQGDPSEYASTPGYEILSRCPNSFTESYVRALRRSAAAKTAILPEDWHRVRGVQTRVRISIHFKMNK